MAEFLIYDTTHWMDRLGEQQKAAHRATYGLKGSLKMEGCLKRGDFIEVQEDGFYTGRSAHGWNRKVFALLVVKGLKRKDVLHLAEPLVSLIPGILPDGEMARRTDRERRYQVDIGSLTGKVTKVAKLEQVTIVDKKV